MKIVMLGSCFIARFYPETLHGQKRRDQVDPKTTIIRGNANRGNGLQTKNGRHEKTITALF